MKRIPLRSWLLLAVVPLLNACAALQGEDLQPKVDSLTSENQKLTRDNQELSSRLATSESQRSQLDRQIKTKDAEAAATKRRDLGDGVTMEEHGKEAVVKIPADLAFPSGVSDLSQKGQGVLDQVLTIVKKDYPNSKIRVEGHADTDPISKTKDKNHCNWDLAFKRAHSVMHYMTTKGGVDPKTVSVASFGEYQPADPGQKSKNRRVELVIVRN